MQLTAAAVAAEAGRIAQSHVGEGRSTDPEHVANVLAVFGLPPALDGKPVAYCACEVSADYLEAICRLSGIPYNGGNAPDVFRTQIPTLEALCFRPDPSVSRMVQWAQEDGRWLDWDSVGNDVTIEPSWLICFSWPDGGHHIGMVRTDLGDSFATVEGNTSLAGVGGMIADKIRDGGVVWGFIKTYEAPVA
jgi:hypothetical protein